MLCRKRLAACRRQISDSIESAAAKRRRPGAPNLKQNKRAEGVSRMSLPPVRPPGWVAECLDWQAAVSGLRVEPDRRHKGASGISGMPQGTSRYGKPWGNEGLETGSWIGKHGNMDGPSKTRVVPGSGSREAHNPLSSSPPQRHKKRCTARGGAPRQRSPANARLWSWMSRRAGPC